MFVCERFTEGGGETHWNCRLLCTIMGQQFQRKSINHSINQSSRRSHTQWYTQLMISFVKHEQGKESRWQEWHHPEIVMMTQKAIQCARFKGKIVLQVLAYRCKHKLQVLQFSRTVINLLVVGPHGHRPRALTKKCTKLFILLYMQLM